MKSFHLFIYLLGSQFSLCAQTNVLDKPVSISCADVPIKEVLQILSRKTNATFTYCNDLVTLPKKVTLNENDKPLRYILNQVFSGTNIEYGVIGNQIIFQTKKIHKRHTVSGYIREEGSGELLIGVNVWISELKTGTVSNTYGFYSLSVLTDTITLNYSYVGYIPIKKSVILTSNQEIDIVLKAGTMLKEVVINADAATKLSESANFSNISVPIAQIKSLPCLLGEKDVFKVFQLMPGVQKGMEGSSGLYVRGGGPDQNLIILDDAIVYNANHLFGFYSLFNGDALKSAELTKGGFPAHFGGRLSSVLEMNMKEGNKETWHAEGGIGLIDSRLTVEGPLKKNKSSILLSGRRTYLDLLVTPFLSKKDGKSGYYFYDLNAKINYDFGTHNKIYLSGYFGKDAFSLKRKYGTYDENGGFNWGNATATMRWNHLFNNKLFSNLSLVYSKYKFLVQNHYVDTVGDRKNYNGEYYSSIEDYTLKYDLDFMPSPKHWLKAGVEGIIHNFNPYAYVILDEANDKHQHAFSRYRGIETAVYLEDTYQPFSFLKCNLGLRYTSLFAQTKQYHYLEPRVSIAWRLKNDIAIKSSYANMTQYIHLLSNTGVSLPTDLWVPSNDFVPPQKSKQVALGVVKDFSNPVFSLSLEGYYKKMDHIIGYKEGASYIEIENSKSVSDISWESNVTSGQGWSHGIELLLQRKTGRLSGWIGYTLSWTQQQFDSVNMGRKFYARYDRRHDISIVGIYKLNERITFSATWVFGTGNALTIPTFAYTAYSNQVPAYTSNETSNGNFQFANYDIYGSLDAKGVETKNNFRMAPYHRLDIGIQFHKQKKWGERTWEISIYNVYNRHNPFFYYSETNSNGVGVLKQVSLFPIIPTISYSFKF